jgi:hypothetical protein
VTGHAEHTAVKLLIRPATPTGPGPVTTSGQVPSRARSQSNYGSHPRSPAPSSVRSIAEVVDSPLTIEHKPKTHSPLTRSAEERQNYGRSPELVLPSAFGHHPSWPSPSSTSPSVGSSGSSSHGDGPIWTRSSRSSGSATRWASSNGSSTCVSGSAPSTGRSSGPSADGCRGRVGEASSSPPTPWCAGTGNSSGASADVTKTAKARATSPMSDELVELIVRFGRENRR